MCTGIDLMRSGMNGMIYSMVKSVKNSDSHNFTADAPTTSGSALLGKKMRSCMLEIKTRSLYDLRQTKMSFCIALSFNTK